MGGNRGIDQIAAEGPEPHQRAIPASRLYPTTSATRIATRVRVSPIAPSPACGTSGLNRQITGV
jgi:hypothetical protein